MGRRTDGKEAELPGSRSTQIILALIAAGATVLAAYWQFSKPQANPGAQEEGKSQKTGTSHFLGRVSDAATGRRLRGAKVSLEARGVPPILYTDSEGIFSFPLTGSLEEVRVVIQADGYQDYDRRIDLDTTSGIEDLRLDLAKAVVKPSLPKAVERVDSVKLKQLRIAKALEAVDSNGQVDSHLASLSTAFENLFKGRTQTIDGDRDKPLIAEIYDLHNIFNRDAWSWFPRLIQEAEVLNLLDRAEVAYAKSLAQCYDRALIIGVQPLEPFWFILERPPAKSPPQQLSVLVQDVREKLRSGAQDRAPIVAELTKALQRTESDPIPAFRCKFSPSSEGRPGTVQATGIGFAPSDVKDLARRSALAGRAAEVVAMRNLAESVRGAVIDSYTETNSGELSKDVVGMRVNAVLMKARKVREFENADGSVSVIMEAPVRQ